MMVIKAVSGQMIRLIDSDKFKPNCFLVLIKFLHWKQPRRTFQLMVARVEYRHQKRQKMNIEMITKEGKYL